MKTYYVYIVLCADGSFYIGVTNNVERRVGEHQFGIDPDCYTFQRRPLKLVYASEFYDVRDAIAWEKRIKGWSHAKKAALVKGDWRRIRELARARPRPRRKARR